jgi:hypothetical protein
MATKLPCEATPPIAATNKEESPKTFFKEGFSTTDNGMFILYLTTVRL